MSLRNASSAAFCLRRSSRLSETSFSASRSLNQSTYFRQIREFRQARLAVRALLLEAREDPAVERLAVEEAGARSCPRPGRGAGRTRRSGRNSSTDGRTMSETTPLSCVEEPSGR